MLRAGHRISAQAVALDDATLLFGAHDGVLYAGDLSGALRWRANLVDRIYTTPLVTESAVYVGSDADRMVSLTPRGHISVALGTDDDADTSANRSDDGAIYFTAGRTLYRVDADMTVRWRTVFGGKLYSAPALFDDGTVVLGCQDDHIYAVNPDGRIRWQFSTGGDVDATPAVGADGTVYVGSDDGALYALTPDGALRWRTPLGGYIRAGAGLSLDHGVVVGTYGPRPGVVMLDADTGAIRWRHSIAGPPSADYGVLSAPLIDAEGAIAIGTPDDSVLIFEEDGRLRARIAVPGDVDAPPVLMGDATLVVGCDDGAMRVFGEPPVDPHSVVVH